MELKELANLITHFDKNAFACFFNELLLKDNIKPIRRCTDTIWSSPAERFFQSEEAYFLQYYPVGCFKDFCLNDLNYTPLIDDIVSYQKQKPPSPWVPVDGITYYIINNFDSSDFNITDNELLKYYEAKLSQENAFSGMATIGVGNVNTFLSESTDNYQKVASVMKSFAEKYKDGICISVTQDKIIASEFIAQKEFSGATKSTLSLIQPVIKTNPIDGLFASFNKLINSDASEHLLEEFLCDNYKELFGYQYDRIATQLWLKFPDLDIGRRDRRLDIFMRNTIKEDWDLFELKKSNVELAKNITGVPMFTASVHNAIAQAKNYQHLLSQDKIKSILAKDGIEYYEPEINIVIGRKPSIPNQQWRRMVVDTDQRVKILTYDQLLKEATIRLESASKIYNNNF